MRLDTTLRYFLLLLFVCAVANVNAQKTEWRANAYGGFFHFRGNGAVSVATISNSGPADEPGYYNAYPYGRKSDFSCAFELQAQRVTKGGHLYGAGISFENLKSRLQVDSVWTRMGKVDVDGIATLSNRFITVTPYIGHRFAAKRISVDVTAGLDVGFSTSVQGEATFRLDKKYIYGGTYGNHPVDLRPRVQLTVSYKNIGLAAGYSMGTTNLYNTAGYGYLNKEAYTNFLRLGLSYRFK